MLIIPAIDLRSGKVVRLKRGDFNKETVYSDEPASFAKKWEEGGASWIHVVDLDGAKEGNPKNWDSLKKIRSAVSISIEFGGGLRNEESIKKAFEIGADRIVIGTKALDEKWVKEILAKYGDKIAVGLDFKRRDETFGVSTGGWLDSKEYKKEELLGKISELEANGARHFIFTDIMRDGTLEGPAGDILDMIFKKVGNSGVILSGGVSSLKDIRNLTKFKAKNFEGVIVGKALYENRFSLAEAVNLASKDEGV